MGQIRMQHLKIVLNSSMEYSTLKYLALFIQGLFLKSTPDYNENYLTASQVKLQTQPMN